MVLVIINVLFGFTFLVLSYIIGKKQILEILAGYKPEEVKDKTGLAKWVGINLLLMGVLTFLASIIMAGLPEVRITVFLVHIIVLLPIICIRIVLGNRRYMRK